MDVNSLFQALQGATSTAQKDSPFAPFSDVAQNIGGLLIKNSAAPGNSLGETVVASLLDGLIGGVGDRLTNSYVADQGTLARNALQDAINGKALSMPDGMNPSVFNNIQNAASLYNVQKQQDVKDMIQKAAINDVFNDPFKSQYLTNHGYDMGALSGVHPAAPLATAETDLPSIQLDPTKGLDPTIAAALPSPTDTINAAPTLAPSPSPTPVVSGTNPALPDKVYTPLDFIDQAGGDVTSARELANYYNNLGKKELPEQINAKVDAATRLKDQASVLLPTIQRIEQSLTPDQKLMNYAQLRAAGAIPTSDISLLESGFPAFTAALVQTGRTARFPIAEFNAFNNALSGAAPLAAALGSKRLAQYTNEALKGIGGEIDQYARPGGEYSKAANFLKSQNPGLFKELQLNNITPDDAIAELKKRGRL